MLSMNEEATNSLIEGWKKIQNDLKLRQKESENSTLDVSTLSKIGGLDVSFHINKSDVVCVTLVVLEFPSLKVIYEDTSLEKINEPYIPGFLAFREVHLFEQKMKVLQEHNKNYIPDVVLVDGNGILHFNRFGSASHFGVVCNLPSIGVAKNLYVIEEEGIKRDEEHKAKIQCLMKKGDHFPITTCLNETLGMAVRTSNEATNPVYVSVGHRCNLDVAVKVVINCSNVRIPEPIRQADMRSRKFLRDNFPLDYP